MPATTPTLLVFGTPSYDPLSRALCQHPGFELAELERTHFPDGERYLRLVSDVNGRDVVIVGGTIDAADTLEIYDLACAIVAMGAHTLTIVIPFYGYQTMERAQRNGEVIVAKTRARLLSSVPTAGSGNRVVLIDLHAEGIAHYFGDMRAVHLHAKPVTLQRIRTLAGNDEFVLGATDAGRAKWVESLANDLGVDAAFVFKRRVSGSETEVTALAADVKDKHVIIYDDMIRTGGSLLGAAQAYLDSGATRISAVTTHGVLPNTSLDKLQRSGLLQCVACTDSHPRALELQGSDFLIVDPLAPLIAGFLTPS